MIFYYTIMGGFELRQAGGWAVVRSTWAWHGIRYIRTIIIIIISSTHRNIASGFATHSWWRRRFTNGRFFYHCFVAAGAADDAAAAVAGAAWRWCYQCDGTSTTGTH